MAENTNNSGYTYYVNQGQKIAAQISRAGTAPLLSKMYTSTSLTATNFYNGATFGQDIGSEIPIIYGEILLSGYTLDSGTLRSDIDPDQLLKVYRFMTGEGPVKGVKGVGEDKLQNVIIGCEETVDATTGTANKPHIGLGEVLGIGGGLALMTAPAIAKLFKKDPLTGKDIPLANASNSASSAAANVTNQVVNLDGVAITDGDVLTYDTTSKKIVNKKLSDMLRERLELINHCCVEGQAADGSDDPADGASASKPKDPCDELQLDTSVSFQAPPKEPHATYKLLPHDGSNKVYSETIDLSRPGTVTIHLFYRELALKKITSATKSPSSNYGGTVSDYKNVDVTDGSVKLAYCLVVDGEIKTKGRKTISGWSAFNNSENFSFDWEPEPTSCNANGNNYSGKNGELRIYREDNHSSSTDMFLQGYSFVAKAASAPTKDTPKLPTPVQSGHSAQKDDDDKYPAKEPSGGTYKSIACFPTDEDEGNEDCSPCAELEIKDVGSGGGQDGGGTDPTNPTKPKTTPTISCDEPRDRTYDPGKLVTVILPKWTVTSGMTDDKTVDVSFIMSGGNGSLGIASPTAGATVKWDATTKTLTVSGDETVVSSSLQSLFYQPGSKEGSEIEYTATVKNKELAEVSAAKNFIHNEDLAHPGKSATLAVTIAGTTGTLKISVKGKDIMTEVASNASNTVMATAVAAAINNASTTPDFTASSSGATVTLISPEGKGGDFNGMPVSFTSSGNRTLNGVTAGGTAGTLAGGENGNKASVSIGSKLGKFALDILPAIGGGLIANTLMNTIGNIKVEIPADQEDANISVLMQGLMINVPSNYNADTRTYTGTWDYSTFKQAYTTNPAWCLLDFIESKRYGCGNSVRLDAAQKLQLYKDCYAAALRCDESVNNLAGGTEPRYTINTAIAGMSRLEVLDALAGVMHSQVVFTSNGMRVVQDRPREAMGIVCNANVINGEFTYSGGSLDATYNIVDVAYNNPDKYFVEESLYVQDTSDLIARGFELRNSVTAFGTTSTGQATRYGAWVIQTEKTNPSIVNYTAGFDHEKYIPGDIVCVVNNFDEEILGTKTFAGRIKSISGTTIELDRPIDKTNGYFYYMAADGTMVKETGVGYGNEDNIITVSASNNMRVGAVWAQFADIKKNYFKIVSISENNDGTFSVSAIKHDADKYSAIDGFAAIQ